MSADLVQELGFVRDDLAHTQDRLRQAEDEIKHYYCIGRQNAPDAAIWLKTCKADHDGR